MNGCQLTFFTLQDRRHGHQPMTEWLMHVAKSLGVRGSTLVGGAEGIDHTGKRHSAHFFELADQPIEITMVMTTEQAQALLNRLEQQHADVFYIRSAVEFGVVGERDSSAATATTPGNISKAPSDEQ